MRSITFDPRAQERRDNLQFRAITNRAISNALNRNHLYIPSKPPKPSFNAADVWAGVCLGVLIACSFGLAYAASHALGDFVGPAIAALGM